MLHARHRGHHRGRRDAGGADQPRRHAHRRLQRDRRRRALKLAEERGISLREYQIIYNLVDDVKARARRPPQAHRGSGSPGSRGGSRRTFKVGKVGTHRRVLRDQRRCSRAFGPRD